jgi:endonuclease/exonuclease/phosphatase family metal-dependent hydrolase
MKKILIILNLLVANLLFAQELSIISWNLKDFGHSRDDKEINAIAKVIRHADIVCVQEVVAKHPGGAQAVARLVEELDRMGANWDYVISDPTQSTSPHVSERYAFLWKSNKVKKIGRARLLTELAQKVEREPYLINFNHNGQEIVILNYHACTHKADNPERQEIVQISKWLNDNSSKNTIWAGDMNLGISDEAFNTIKQSGYKSALNGEKTSLKKSCKKGNYLSRAEDNVLYKLESLDINGAEVLDFIETGDCTAVTWKRNSYSDHLPIQLILR